MKKNVSNVLLAGISVIVILIAGCNPSKKWEKEEKQKIQEYLAGLGDTAYVTKPSGLVVISLTEGTGSLPVVNDTVSVWYKGSFLSRRVFGTNETETLPLTFVAGTGYMTDGSGYLIEGLAEGVQYIKKGGKARLLTPSALAYGPYGRGIISGFTPLLWEIEVVEIKPGPGK